MFLRSLLNAGIDASDAQCLEAYYGNEPEFIDGLEMIARAVAGTAQLPLLPPAGQPWRTLHAAMQGAQDVNGAFFTCLAGFASDIQIAITGAISIRVGQIQTTNGQVNPGKKKRSGDYIQMLTNMGYAFKYNVCTQYIEVNGTPISDPIAAEMRSKLRDAGVDQVAAAEDAYLAYAWNNRYHPIRDYFAELKYQGGDVITEFCNFVQDDHQVFGAFMRRWLIGSVARVMGRAQNRMLVLDGPQGMGKDYLARWLCSPMPEYYHEGAIDPENKDCRIRLMSTWIWTVSELGATTRKNDREALKSFLTMETIRDRRAYGRFDIQGPALSSFIGTINNEGGFLSDPTGNRRFMTCKLSMLDWGYTKLDVDQIWAQAYDLYLRGEPWDLQPDEIQAANKINDIYQIDDVVEAAILKYLQVDAKQQNWWVPTVDIVQELEGKGIKFGSPTAASMAIGKAMTAIGLQKLKRANTRGQLVNGYTGVQII